MDRIDFPASPKRAVFTHPDGMCQILGMVPETPPVVLAYNGTVLLRGRAIAFASLYRVTPRIAYYKEPVIPTSVNTFHEAQV